MLYNDNKILLWILVDWSFSCSKNSVYVSRYCTESLVVPNYVLSYSQGSVRSI